MSAIICCVLFSYLFPLANYIQLEYESRSVALVNEQRIYLYYLTPVFLTCMGTLPHWYNYPTSNTTLNSNTLYIDVFDRELEGDYSCRDNSTGDVTLITITTSQGSFVSIYVCYFNPWKYC